MKKQNLINLFFAVIIIVLIYCIYITKQNELNMAEELMREKFKIGSYLVALNEPYFDWSNEPLFINDWSYLELMNYDAVCEEYLTSNAKKYFDENAICLVWIDNKPYIAEGGKGFSGYGGIRFENIKVTDDEIEATVIQKRFNTDEEFEGEWKMQFKIVKINDIWKIDTFADVDDEEMWEEV